MSRRTILQGRFEFQTDEVEPMSRRLREDDWPGSVQELQNVIERAIIISDPEAPDIGDR